MDKKREQIWVDPDFATMLRIKANTRGLRYVDYTREVARNPSIFVTETDMETRYKKKRYRGDNFGSLF